MLCELEKSGRTSATAAAVATTTTEAKVVHHSSPFVYLFPSGTKHTVFLSTFRKLFIVPSVQLLAKSIARNLILFAKRQLF